MERTAQQHRAETESWAATAPKNDSTIFGRKLKTDNPRNRDLSNLSALLAMRSRPMGVAEGVPTEPEPIIQTNWRIAPANDNTPPEDGFGADRSTEIVPSIEKIMEAAKYKPEQGFYIDERDKRHKITIAIGNLKFSDGSAVEQCFIRAPDGSIVEGTALLPIGALTQSREKSTRDKGGDEEATGSNAHYRWMVKGRIAKPPKMKPKKQERLAISKEQAREMLAEAYANTPVLPDVKSFDDGFPASPTNLRQLFMAGRKGKKGESGSQAWQDIFTEKENREQFARGLDAMQEEHFHVLTEAMSATSLRQLGEARGFKGRHAIDAGRRLLVAANDNFVEAMKLAEYAKAS